MISTCKLDHYINDKNFQSLVLHASYYDLEKLLKLIVKNPEFTEDEKENLNEIIKSLGE